MKSWNVAWKDRGMGHGDYGIIDDEENLIAEIKTGMGEDAFLMSAAPELEALAIEVAKEYEDAADWKDAICKLQNMARIALEKINKFNKPGTEEHELHLNKLEANFGE